MPSIFRALRRTKVQILTVGLVYFLTVLGGILMVHEGWPPAVNFRDRLVAKALGNDRASIALAKGKRLEAGSGL